jgi:hypothetical protein
MPRPGSSSPEKGSVAVLVTWIDEQGEQVAAPVEDGSLTPQLDHQRRLVEL